MFIIKKTEFRYRGIYCWLYWW